MVETYNNLLYVFFDAGMVQSEIEGKIGKTECKSTCNSRRSDVGRVYAVYRLASWLFNWGTNFVAAMSSVADSYGEDVD
jgi:hypothetical protein